MNVEQLEDRRMLSLTASAEPLVLLTTPLDLTDPTISSGQLRGGPNLTYDEIFNLQSKPDSNFTLFLDFDGHVTTDTPWNSSYNIDTIVSPPFDLDGNFDSFGEMELERILISWQRTAEDFSPFDINVTTRFPGLDALMNSGGGDTTWGVRAVVTNDTFADCQCGGHAFLNTFDASTDIPTFVYNKGEGSLGETFAHEVGHMLGLNHDGTSSLAYYRGHGTNNLAWGAIMGAPFDMFATQWDRGEYFDANNQEDDLQIITTQNGFTYRPDDVGNTRPTATPLTVSGTTGVHAFGFIERNTDLDYFSFATGGGLVSLDIEPLAHRPNLDVWAGLYNSAGTLIAQSNPGDVQFASLTNIPVSAGTYYVRVEGIGSHDVYNAPTDTIVGPAAPVPWSVSPPAGYSNYGSLGQYTVNGVIVAPSLNTFHIAATDAVKLEGGAGTQVPLTFTVSRSGNTAVPATVDFAVRATLPTAVGNSYPNVATANDFIPGTLLQGSLSFAADEISKVVTFNAAGDNLFEQDESFDVDLSNPAAGWFLGDSRATGVILSDEANFGVTPISATSSVNEGPYQGTLLRWRQVTNAFGATDQWAIDNVNLANSTFGDDFDPTLDQSNWIDISNGEVNNTFGGTGNSLFMTGGVSGFANRWATSKYVSPQPGDQLTFDLIIGNGTNGGENNEAGKDIVLEFSNDGGSHWTQINVYKTNQFATWTTIQEVMPDAIDDLDPGTVRFLVARDGGSTLPATVQWQVETAGATNPADAADFLGGILPSGQVEFAAGQRVAEIRVPIQGDVDFEPNEQFFVSLTSVSGSSAFQIDGDNDTGIGVIRNDDSSYVINPGPQFRWRQIAFSNGNFDNWGLDNLGFTGGVFGDDFDPDIDLSQWSDVIGGLVNTNFGGTGNSLFFTGANPRIAATKPISAQLGDVLAFSLIFGNNNNGGENPEPGENVVLEYSLDGGATWTLITTYLENQFTTWTQFQVPVPANATAEPIAIDEGNAGSTTYTFKVQRGGNTTTGADVAWTVAGSGANPANGADFVGGSLPNGILSFAPNETSKIVEVFVAGDTFFEPDETFDFTVLASGSPSVTATILNDDQGLVGDFNQDGIYDCTDVNDLVTNIATQSGNLLYDLNSDGLLNTADLQAWLTIAGAANLPSGNPYLLGDGNLDGVVDGSDFGVWNANKFTNGAGWCGGDFNADGATDGSDFGIWNANKFTSALDGSRGMATRERMKLDRQNAHMPLSFMPELKRVEPNLSPLSRAVPRSGARVLDEAFASWNDDESAPATEPFAPLFARPVCGPQ